MITLLVVDAGERGETPALAASHPSVEILVAGGTEEALEKLARNRRIDAVLLLDGAQGRELAAVLREEDPSAPPLFASASAGEVPGARPLAATDPEALLELLTRELEPRR